MKTHIPTFRFVRFFRKAVVPLALGCITGRAGEVAISLKSTDYDVVGYQEPVINIEPTWPAGFRRLSVSGLLILNLRGTLKIPKIDVPVTAIESILLESKYAMSVAAGGSGGGYGYFAMVHDARAGFPRPAEFGSGPINAPNDSSVSGSFSGTRIIQANDLAAFVLTGQNGEPTEIQIDLIAQMYAEVGSRFSIPPGAPAFAWAMCHHTYPRFRLVYVFKEGFTPPALIPQGDGPELTWAKGAILDTRPAPPPPEDWWPGEITGNPIKQGVEFLSPGHINLSVTGLAGFRYTLESSGSLHGFAPLESRSGDGSVLRFEIREDPGQGNAFYRITSSPE